MNLDRGQRLVHPDSRNRVALTGLVNEDTYYIVEREEDGTIVLTPAVVVPVRQASD